jgi:hypothetical protein
MTNLPPDSERDERPAGDRTTPRWVIVLAVVILALVLLFVVSRLLGIQHGPDLHSLAEPDLAFVHAIAA